MLAAFADFHNPLFWAVFIGWVLSVVLHEFAHGLVAYLGGDWTVRERGGLTLNPLQYVDPVMSLLLPAVILLMGGVPLPGGVTYVRRDLLRSRAWSSAVSLAGPAMNLLLFLACALPLHPRFGWMRPWVPVDRWPPAQLVLATTASLQLIAVVLNLVPVPPLDGFQAISPFLPADFRRKVMTPPTSTILFLAFFFVLWQVPAAYNLVFKVVTGVLGLLGFDERSQNAFRWAFNFTMFGSPAP